MHNFCHFCGTAYTQTETYPRTCTSCNKQVWNNPIPVVVVLIPVVDGNRDGLLLQRRGIMPGKGKLALPGGFLEIEDWKAGAVREVKEEMGITIDPQSLDQRYFVSTEPYPNRVLLFVSAAPIELSELLDTTMPVSEEVQERVILWFAADEDISTIASEIAFPLHYQAIRNWYMDEATFYDLESTEFKFEVI